jgi:magnesium chelatase subunit D
MEVPGRSLPSLQISLLKNVGDLNTTPMEFTRWRCDGKVAGTGSGGWRSAGTEPNCSSRSPHCIDLAKKSLAELLTGEKTPLSAGLWKAAEVFDSEKKNGSTVPVLILISDGRANSPSSRDTRGEALEAAGVLYARGVHTVVIDTEETRQSFLKMRLGYCREIAEAAGGWYYQVSDLSPGVIRDISGTEIAGLFSGTHSPAG